MILPWIATKTATLLTMAKENSVILEAQQESTCGPSQSSFVPPCDTSTSRLSRHPVDYVDWTFLEPEKTIRLAAQGPLCIRLTGLPKLEDLNQLKLIKIKRYRTK